MGASPRSLQDIEPPFGIILDELRSGNAIPFLGAGASRLATPERYEVFHDVLAQPILDWRRGYLDEQERAAAE